jgi:methionine synthase I (cobalamin-dependent)
VTPTIAGSPPASKPEAGPGRQSARMPLRLLDAIHEGPLVLDAGMGTRLVDRGLDLRRDDPCLWNLDEPEQVLDIHRRDADAGSRVLFTNTFGANRARLGRLGRGGHVVTINRMAVEVARRASGPEGFVAGDIGPTCALEPGAAREQARILVESGVDALVLETFELESALAALGELGTMGVNPRPPLIVGLWRWPDAVEDAARRLVEAGADIIGLNCRPAMSQATSLLRRFANAVACPLLVKPGVDTRDPAGGSTPAAFAAAVPGLLEHNVRLIGGCCGTTEAHIAALASACAVHRLPETHLPGGADS